ncbi:Phospholipase A2-like domain [Popillia japonica]|uniref:Phospholipase A2-like domain n=1 Tax=Popillia japonica TaxID=7064 RepID=A0AAW1JCB0_POPJA
MLTFTQGGGLLNSLINNLPVELHLPGYPYCGPGTKLQKHLARGDPGINLLDAACKEHDIAYSQNKDLSSRHRADLILENKAWSRVKSKDACVGEKAAAWSVTNAMKIKRKLGMGLKKRQAFKKCFKKILNDVENNPVLTLTDEEFYTIGDCIEVIKESYKEIKSTTISRCWKNLLPDAVINQNVTVDILREEVEEITSLSQQFVEGAVQELNTTDIEELEEITSLSQQFVEGAVQELNTTDIEELRDKEEISEKPNATAINEATNDENPADTPASAIAVEIINRSPQPGTSSGRVDFSKSIPQISPIPANRTDPKQKVHDRKQHSIILTSTPMKHILEDAKEKKELKQKAKTVKRYFTDCKNNKNIGKKSKTLKQNKRTVIFEAKTTKILEKNQKH